PVEHYGKEASAFTKAQLEGKRVLMFVDAGDKDRYGRMLRYVFVEGQELMFNELLLQEGYANTMTIAPNVAFADYFVDVERAAREQERGLWREADKGDNVVSNKSGAEEVPTSNACKQPDIKGN